MRFAWQEAFDPLIQSATVAAISASVSVVLAWALAWSSRQPNAWRGVLALVIAVALAAPGPVAGMALVYAYRDFPTPAAVVVAGLAIASGLALQPGRGRRWVGSLTALAIAGAWLLSESWGRAFTRFAGLALPEIYDSALALGLAGVLRTFPFAWLILWPAIRTIPRELLDAAAVDGLGTMGQIRYVALPLTRPAILAAWGVAFVLAFGELPATNLVTPPGMLPLSVLIWSLLHTGVESHLAGVVLVMLGAVGITGGLAAYALGRMFRVGAQ